MAPSVREPPPGELGRPLASSPGGGRHSPPEAGVGKDPNVRDDSPLGADPGSARDAQERERRPPVGTARRRRASGRTPTCGTAPLSARTLAALVTRRKGNADLRPAQPAGGGRSRVSPHTGMVLVSALSPSQEVAFPCPAALPLSQHCAARPASRGGADRRSAQFSRWGLPCLRVAPPGGLGAMRHVQRPRGAFCDSASAPEYEKSGFGLATAEARSANHPHRAGKAGASSRVSAG